MAQGITSGPLWDKLTHSLLGIEGAAHRRVRSVVSKAFTPRASARLHDTIVAVINDLIDRVAADGRCDVVSDIARPYPVPVICALLGAPRRDWEQFSRWADDIFTAFTLNPDGIDEERVMRAWGELDDYVDDMVAERRRAPREDLLSDLIRAEQDGDRLSADELRMLAGGLLLAGTDTTRNQLAASVDALVEHPDQWVLLAERPGLAAQAVEETIRHAPSVGGTLRVTTHDTVLADVLFPAGTLVLLNTFAANRDTAVYDEPERFDMLREGAPAVLTFGGGIHYCLGANLARLELCEALRILTHRMRQRRAHRAGAVEADDGVERTHHAAHRVLPCVVTVGRAMRRPLTKRPSTGSWTWPTASSPGAAPRCASPMWRARWGSPGRRCTATSRAPRSCCSPARCAPPTVSSTSWPSTSAA